VLVKDHLHSTMLFDKIKDTLIVKIPVGRSRMLFVVTSYFPCTTEIKWEKCFERIQVELSHYCEQYQFRNIVVNHNFTVHRDLYKSVCNLID